MASERGFVWGWSFRQNSDSAKETVMKDSPEMLRIRSEVNRIKKENSDLVADTNRQNAYDISRGLTPGKFREHFTTTCIETNQMLIDDLEEEYRRLQHGIGARWLRSFFDALNIIPNALEYAYLTSPYKQPSVRRSHTLPPTYRESRPLTGQKILSLADLQSMSNGK